MRTQTRAHDAWQYIGGSWRHGADGAPNVNPSTGEEIGEVARGGAADVDDAVAAASSTAAAWAAVPASGRGRILFDAAATLEAAHADWAVEMALEMGKPVREARMECLRAVAILRYFAEELHRPIGEHYLADQADSWLFTRREPVGVVGLITPWNFPAAIPTWKLAPALAFGNAVVLKLASDAPATGLRLVAALADAGLPEGVLNVVLGPGALVGGRLVDHPAVHAISFTGSSDVGRDLIAAAAAGGKRVQAEMGGHNPAIVRADAHLDQAVDAILAGGFASAGQKCTATRRVYVDQSIHDAFVRMLCERARLLRIGDAVDPETALGPLAGRAQLEDVLASVELAAREGTIHAGGGRVEDGRRASGCFMAPTVLGDLAPDSDFAVREVFGPALAVWPTTSDEEALELANRSAFGLSAAIFTRDLNRAKEFVSTIRAGLVHINSQTAGAEVHVPFGGLGGSGYGPHEQGRAAIEFYTQDKSVYLDAAAE